VGDNIAAARNGHHQIRQRVPRVRFPAGRLQHLPRPGRAPHPYRAEKLGRATPKNAKYAAKAPVTAADVASNIEYAGAWVFTETR
jgi:hypothetical protein